MANIDSLRLVINHHNEAVRVPFDIEDGAFPDGIGMAIGLPHVMKAFPVRFLGDAVPCIEWAFHIRVPHRGILQRFSTNDMHRGDVLLPPANFAYRELFVKGKFGSSMPNRLGAPATHVHPVPISPLTPLCGRGGPSS
jgi:hypothetical protein